MSNPINFSVIERTGNVNGKSYSDFVEAYWNWLLGPDADTPVYTGFNFDVIFMRACIDYRPVIGGGGIVRRKNFCSPLVPNTGGGPINIPINTPIFTPILDACFYSGYRDDDDNPISPPQMLTLARNENDNSVVPPPSPTIEREGDPSSRINLVQDTNNFLMQIPSDTLSTFRLKVDNVSRSRLVEKMEDLILPARNQPFDFQAIAFGHYTITRVGERGRYIIISRAVGRGEYNPFMQYTFSIV